ncbi:MAG TPA: L-aspartate oxidase [Alphaproteobacteria bacterium]|nr:L-aspartate oxidase [Alphaproteobacteria bacterium]
MAETEIADAVVVGGGIAGLAAALALAPRRVLLLAKAPLGTGCATAWAQGGIAAAIGPGDAPRLHAADTVAAGAGLVDAGMARLLAEGGPAAIEALTAWGCAFDRAEDGAPLLSQEAAHGRRRVLRADGDGTGREIMRALLAAVRAARHIAVRDDAAATALLRDEADGRICGVRGHGGAGPLTVLAGAVVLATGGIGRLWRHTTNPPEATGDGLAMAARAGAAVADAEFVQFHPTAIATGGDVLPLATEALRGEGATLIDGAGRRLMDGIDPAGELAPRDIVARAIWAALAAGRGAFLDARHLGAAFPTHFPTVFAHCRAAGIDPRREPIPVAPAAHYHMGGLLTDADGRTTLPGLWACGEVAATGVHGANRLASNSLLEGLVFGRRAAAAIAAEPLKEPAICHVAAETDERGQTGPHDPALEARLRQTMFRHVGLVRDAAGLTAALAALHDLPTPSPRLRAMRDAALLVAAAAWTRRESRGGHSRADFPAADPAQAVRRVLTLAQARSLAAEAARQLEPIPA